MLLTAYWMDTIRTNIRALQTHAFCECNERFFAVKLLCNGALEPTVLNNGSKKHIYPFGCDVHKPSCDEKKKNKRIKIPSHSIRKCVRNAFFPISHFLYIRTSHVQVLYIGNQWIYSQSHCLYAVRSWNAFLFSIRIKSMMIFYF